MKERPLQCGRRKRDRFIALYLFVLVIATATGFITPCFAQNADGWRQVDRPREWAFPRDHGAHPEYRTEWWYFTGIVKDKSGGRYGYQLTFFRQGLRPRASDPENPWSVRDIYLAHFTVTNVQTGDFLVNEHISRTGPGLAGARQNGLHVHLLDWSAHENQGSIILNASKRGATLQLNLRPEKPLVVHGKDGLSQKGPGPGQASYYVSYTRLATTGRLQLRRNSATMTVKGTSWFDHEFGSNQLTSDQAGWDWFSLHLSDGRDLMLYVIRRTGGSLEPASSGTIVDADGRSRHLSLPEIRIETLERRKSARSKAEYPSRWHIDIPSEGIKLTIAPLIPDQELLTPGSTGITYWEGAVEGRGVSGNRKVTAEGYIELTGYAGGLGGMF